MSPLRRPLHHQRIAIINHISLDRDILPFPQLIALDELRPKLFPQQFLRFGLIRFTVFAGIECQMTARVVHHLEPVVLHLDGRQQGSHVMKRDIGVRLELEVVEALGVGIEAIVRREHAVVWLFGLVQLELREVVDA